MRALGWQSIYLDQMRRFQVGEDSPVFPGLFSYCQVTPELAREVPTSVLNTPGQRAAQPVAC